ncbi:MAG: D-tyrosyl-tRNA(Tyr) deacylase [Ruminococcaceae bacterium]|nr:D-tyrosyl-tRNA(Tyr) deacylase [Oscillospiraceae bacterium]MBQ6873998.1 D-tyrosyl-tRNA(Tyr) deacylase [Clostridia bacterium]
MKAVIQRVSRAGVTVDGSITGEIGNGYLILLGVVNGDTEKEMKLMAQKVANLRIFTDENDKMNLSLLDVDGEALVVSQFTLCADVSHGRRPSFINSAPPAEANRLYELFCEELRNLGVKKVATGIFGAHMDVELLNNGPVTILFNTDEWKRG